VPQTKYKARYKLPSSRDRGGHPFYWLLVFALAIFFGWLWWRSGHSSIRKELVVQTKVAVNAAPVTKASATAPSTQHSVTPAPDASSAPFPRPVQSVFEAQIALVGQGISPGSIDGALGSQTHAAVAAFQRDQGFKNTGQLDDITRSNLVLNEPPLTTYTITAEDVARLQPIASTWLGKSQQSALDFESILELVAEKTFTHPNLVRRLNPAINWSNVVAGTILQVPNASYPDDPAKAAWVTIHLASRTLEAFDAETNLIAHFPCSIAKHVEKRPVGLLHVAVIAPHPNYTFDPEVFPESVEGRQLHRKLVLPPGPNNPVGVAWIGLDRPGYGIHGTPRPEDVGRTESHGCFRLANWNAEFLLRMVTIGTPVYVVE
jgi:lipoprotein-anchoring transpeptidase ErfK/SrfK